MSNLRFFVIALVLSASSHVAQAGVMTLAQTMFEEEPLEPTKAEEAAEAAEEHGLDDEVQAFEQEELQEKFQNGVGLGVGIIAPWQKIALQGLMRAGEGRMWAAHLGGGAFSVTGERLSRTYELSITSYSFTLGHRWAINRLMPFFIEPMLGYGAWRGRIAPRGSDPATDTIAAKLDSSFSASGLVAGAQFGLFWLWENGVFLEYSIFRIGRGFPFTSAYSGRSAEARDVVRENLGSWYSWGYVNLTLGWTF